MSDNKYTIKLKYGSFFFYGKVSITGNGNEVTVDKNDLTSEDIKALLLTQKSGVIETDLPEYVEETFRADVSVQSEVVEEAKKEESNEEPQVEEITEKAKKKANKRG